MNLQANVFFLDEPIGVGFSHADNGQVSLPPWSKNNMFMVIL